MTAPQQLSDSSRRWTLIVTALAAFLTPFMSSSITVALPAIGKEFDLNAVLLGWVPQAFLLVASIALLPAGKLADQIGMHRVFALGTLIYTLASAVSALAPTAAVLLGSRAAQGLGGAMMFGTATAILTAAYPAEQRGRVLGVNVAAVYLGLSLGPFIGGFLTEYAGWRSIFAVMVPLGLLIAAAVRFRMQADETAAKHERFDTTGTLLYAAGLTGLMLGLGSLPATAGVVEFAAGALFLGLFLRRQTSIPVPLLDIPSFRGNTAFVFSNVAAFINYSATAAVTFLLSLYLQYARGLSPRETGVILVAQPIMMTLFSPLAGRLSDRVEPRIVASAGMGVTAAGLLVFAWLQETTSIPLIVAALAVLGLGFAFFSSPNTNAVMSSVERRAYGVASAMLGTMRLTGQMTSLGIAMLAFALFIGRARPTPETLPGMLHATRLCFAFFAAVCAVGVFASLARGRVHRQTKHATDV